MSGFAQALREENGLPSNSILEIVAYVTWDGGKIVDNSVFSKRGMFLKATSLSTMKP